MGRDDDDAAEAEALAIFFAFILEAMRRALPGIVERQKWRSSFLSLAKYTLREHLENLWVLRRFLWGPGS